MPFKSHHDPIHLSTYSPPVPSHARWKCLLLPEALSGQVVLWPFYVIYQSLLLISLTLSPSNFLLLGQALLWSLHVISHNLTLLHLPILLIKQSHIPNATKSIAVTNSHNISACQTFTFPDTQTIPTTQSRSKTKSYNISLSQPYYIPLTFHITLYCIFLAA